jgi:mRNA interferase RelE/StbE
MLKIDLQKDAAKFLEKLPPKHKKQIAHKIVDLCENPIPHDSKILKGTSTSFHRVDIGEYRIVYTVEKDVVNIPLIGKRNDAEVYRQFKRKGL